MAPAAIQALLTESIAAKVKLDASQYKEGNPGPEGFNSYLEKKGTNDAPPARYQNYLPTWDSE